MFAITSGKGFHITFPNNITLSTQFGGGNYCSNHDKVEIGTEPQLFRLDSEDAEIAIFERGTTGGWLTRKAYKECFGEELNDDVKGGVRFGEWLKLVDWCRAYKLEEKVEEVRDR